MTAPALANTPERIKMAAARDQPALDPALFVDDRELHQQMARHVGKDRFAAAIKALEREGFPPIIPLFRGRYFPAVCVWLEQRYGVIANGHIATVQDGQEQFHAAKGRRSRLKDRPATAALLGRDADKARARPRGLPRQVHPATGGG